MLTVFTSSNIPHSAADFYKQGNSGIEIPVNKKYQRVYMAGCQPIAVRNEHVQSEKDFSHWRDR